MPSRNMNIKGSTAAASAISAPRVSETSRRTMDCKESVCRRPRMLGDHPEFPEWSTTHHRESQGHAIRDLEGVGIIERNLRTRQPEGHQRDQDMADIT